MRLVAVLSGLCMVYAAQPPHIIHIMADDTGWNDLGFKNKVPNL
jgi:hypothetical protein